MGARLRIALLLCLAVFSAGGVLAGISAHNDAIATHRAPPQLASDGGSGHFERWN